MNWIPTNISSEDKSRLWFIQRMYRSSKSGRDHLLRVENDAEIDELKRVAIEQQHFEMAVVFKDELARRAKEVRV